MTEHPHILPREIDCPFCDAPLDLDLVERIEGRYTCPDCDRDVDCGPPPADEEPARSPSLGQTVSRKSDRQLYDVLAAAEDYTRPFLVQVLREMRRRGLDPAAAACPVCGQVRATAESTCPTCAERSPRPTYDAALATPVPTPRETGPKPPGLGGWLVVFVAYLVINAVSFFDEALAYLALDPSMRLIPGAESIWLLPAVLSFGYGLFSVFVVVQLLRRHRAAPDYARIYLFGLIVIVLVNVALSLLADGGVSLITAGYSIALAMMWWLYFGQSRRVALTFGLPR